MSARDALGQQWHEVVKQNPEASRHEGSVNWLAHATADDREAEGPGSVWDLSFHRRNIRTDRIRYDPDPSNPRTARARQGYSGSSMTASDQQHEVPPVLLVKRAGVYEVADGHHRVTAARSLGATHVNAIVAHSPHKVPPPEIDW